MSARIEPLERRCLLAGGAVDTTFGAGGKRLVDFNGALDEVFDLVVQADGRTVAVGDKGAGGTYGAGGDIGVVRLTETGGFDHSLGGTGILTIDLGGIEHANAVLVQPDGKIVIGGWTKPNLQSFDSDWLVLRLNADGTPDQAFGGGDGVAIIPFGPSGDKLNDLALQPDGKIVGVGLATTSFNNTGLARLDALGELDGTFGTGGKVAHVLNSNGSEASAVALLADGRIVTAGTMASGGAAGGLKTLGIARFQPNGAPDMTLKGTGWSVDNLGVAYPSGLALAPDGGYFVTVTQLAGNATSTYLRKYTSAGDRATFGTSGGVLIGEGGYLGVPAGLVVQSDGKPIVVTTTRSTTQARDGTTTVARLNADGMFDGGFAGGTGKLLLNTGYDSTSAGLDPRGRIILATSNGFASDIYRVTGDPAGKLRGAVFLDSDGDQKRDAAEGPLAGVRVFLDTDFDLVLDPNERFVTTDDQGGYVFDRLTVPSPGGGYPIAVEKPAGHGSFLGRIQAVLSFPDQDMELGDWPVFPGVGVTGRVFIDADNDGAYDNGEAPVPGARLYFDANNNTRPDDGEIIVDLSPNGFYSMAVPGAGTVRQLWPSGYRQTTPANDAGRTVAGAAGQTVANISFADVASEFTAAAQYEVNKRYITFTFDRGVRTGGANPDLDLVNLTTGQTVELYNAIGYLNDRSKISFEPVIVGDPRSPTLPSGLWRATLKAGSVVDNAGNPQPTDITIEFRVLAGDADGDGRITITDYFAADRGRAQRLTGFTNGDFNYSGGAPNADDLMTIDRAFLAEAQPGGVGAPPAPPQPLFGQEPIEDDDVLRGAQALLA